jgi:hypothetical protein
MLKRKVLWWLVLGGLASFFWFTGPKGERLTHALLAAAGIAVMETLRWIVRRVEPPDDSGNEHGGAPSRSAP